MTSEVATTNGRENALLKAVGFDRLAPEQRELGMAIAQRYDLDLLLKHLVLIDGRAYITRDGLLHIAHRSGQLDGIETTRPVLTEDGKHWESTCSVYRKDMGRAFTYTGRYPSSGGNAKYAPEMAVKVGEVAALRRAFDVAAPTAEERWDMEPGDLEPAPKQPTLAERIRDTAAALPDTADSTTSLSAEDFKAWYVDAGIDEARAMAAAKELFPGHKGLLTDEQRYLLKVALS